MGQYAVIGLGRFGTTIALQLMRMGHGVVGIDSDRKVIENLADDLTHTVIADVIDEHAVQELNLTAYDAVIVAIGKNCSPPAISSSLSNRAIGSFSPATGIHWRNWRQG